MHKIHLIVILLIFISCELTLDETSFTHIEEPNVEEFARNIVLADTLDSIYLFTPTTFVFDIDFKDYEIYQIYFSIDGDTLELSSNDSSLFFDFDPVDFEHGTHDIQLSVTSSTETHSLADAAGAEYFQVSKQIIVYNDTKPPAAISIDSIYIEDGTLKISWSEPEKFNFLKLKLHSHVYSDIEKNQFYTKAGLKEELDIHTTEFYDLAYAGGKVAFGIDLIGYDFEIKGELKDFDIVPFKVSATYDNGLVTFKWDSLLLYNQNMLLHIYSYRHYDLKIEDVTKSGTLVDSVNIEFGNQTNWTFTLTSKNSGDYGNRSKYYDVFTLYPGEKFTDHTKLLRSLETNSLYVTKDNNSKIYKYNFETLELEDSSKLIYDSRKNELFANQSGTKLYYLTEKILTEIDPKSLTEVRKINLESIIGKSNTNIWKMTISNDNFFSFQYDGDQYLLNLNSQKIIFQKPIITGLDAHLSGFGTYYIYGDSLYTVSESSVTAERIYLDPLFDKNDLDDIRIYGFSNDNNKIIYTDLYYKKIHTYDIQTDQTLSSFRSDIGYYIDHMSDKLFTLNHDDYGWFDIREYDGSLFKSIDIYDSHIYGWDYRLIGNRVFCGRGFVYEF